MDRSPTYSHFPKIATCYASYQQTVENFGRFDKVFAAVPSKFGHLFVKCFAGAQTKLGTRTFLIHIRMSSEGRPRFVRSPITPTLGVPGVSRSELGLGSPILSILPCQTLMFTRSSIVFYTSEEDRLFTTAVFCFPPLLIKIPFSHFRFDSSKFIPTTSRRPIYRTKILIITGWYHESGRPIILHMAYLHADAPENLDRRYIAAGDSVFR